MATRSAEAAQQHSAEPGFDHQQHNCAGAGRKEGFLAPGFLYWTPPSRRNATRAVNPQKHFAKAVERLTPDDDFSSLHPGPLFVLSLSLSLSSFFLMMSMQPREWEAAVSRGWWPCFTEAW